MRALEGREKFFRFGMSTSTFILVALCPVCYCGVRFPTAGDNMSRGQHELRAWLDRSRMKRCELAGVLGISRPYMTQILDGDRRPGFDTLIHISKLTGVTPSAWAETSMSFADKSKIVEKISA